MSRRSSLSLPPNIVEGGPAGVACGAAQLLLDAQQAVVLGDALAAGGSARLELAGVGGDDEVGDGGVLRLAGAVADHGGPAGALGRLHGLKRLGERADLVELDQDGVGGALGDAAPEAGGVGDEEVVADELDALAEAAGEGGPAGPVVLGHAVLDADDGEARAPVLPEGGHLLARERAAF